jgi:hypothetical protein
MGFVIQKIGERNHGKMRIADRGSRIADFGLRIAGRSGARRSQDMGNTDHFTIPKRLLPRGFDPADAESGDRIQETPESFFGSSCSFFGS